MKWSLRDQLNALFPSAVGPTPITAESSLQEIALQYPHCFEFIQRKYGVHLEPGDAALALKEFTEAKNLPPAQIVFMEIQLAERMATVHTLLPKEARALLLAKTDTKILDVREDWELKICAIPGSTPLTPQLLDQILVEWPRDTVMIVYCHFGVRSEDAATFLADRGFTHVHTIKGGIDAWAAQIDPTLTRYEEGWC